MATAIVSVNLNPNRLDPDLDPARLARAQADAFDRLAELGCTGVRIDLIWSFLEPAPCRFDPAAIAWYQGFFAEAVQRGISVYALLYHPPAWAQALAQRDMENFLVAWRRFCALVREAFGPTFALVQVWNEPNNFLAALKGDATLFHTRKIGRFALPVGVCFETLAALFRIAREELWPGTPIAYNVLANLCPFLPASCGWLDWEHFTDRFLALAHADVDVIALDHYPDTWAPGTGPLEWGCLELASQKVATPGSPWQGKTVIVGEAGYSSAPNFELVGGLPLGRFFPQERDETTMAAWYAAALPHLATLLTPQLFPHNCLNWLNLYELCDPPRPQGGHPILTLEDHFGLVRRDGTAKPAFAVVRDVLAGTPPQVALPDPTWPPWYWRVAGLGRRLQARLQSNYGAPSTSYNARPSAGPG